VTARARYDAEIWGGPRFAGNDVEQLTRWLAKHVRERGEVAVTISLRKIKRRQPNRKAREEKIITLGDRIVLRAAVRDYTRKLDLWRAGIGPHPGKAAA
jgi:hypothetical protein